MFLIINNFYFSVLTSLFFSLIILYFWPRIFKFGTDRFTEIQKIHKEKSFKIGGLSIISTIIIVYLIIGELNEQIILALVCIMPAFLFGFLEDVTFKISPKLRFFATLFSSILLVSITGVIVKNIDISWLKLIFATTYFPILFTILGYTTLSNAINFIDGVNGLATGIATIVFLTLGILYLQAGEIEYFSFAMICSGALFGFWLVNIISGRIFLGDGGSYATGLLIAWCGVDITIRSDISPWAIFFIIIYPASEIILSVIRRLIKSKSIVEADNEHLHSFVFRIMKMRFKSTNINILNSCSGIIITFFGSLPCFYVVFFDFNYIKTIILSIFYFIFYLLIYYYLNKFYSKQNSTN